MSLSWFPELCTLVFHGNNVRGLNSKQWNYQSGNFTVSNSENISFIFHWYISINHREAWNNKNCWRTVTLDYSKSCHKCVSLSIIMLTYMNTYNCPKMYKGLLFRCFIELITALLLWVHKIVPKKAQTLQKLWRYQLTSKNFT
jgi:hypothetical protein